MQTTLTQGEDFPASHSNLHPLFRPLDNQDKDAFTPDNPEACRIAFIDEAAILVTENSISVCLNNGAEFNLKLPSFFVVVTTVNALVPLLQSGQFGIYTLLHSTGFQTINAPNEPSEIQASLSKFRA